MNSKKCCERIGLNEPCNMEAKAIPRISSGDGQSLTSNAIRMESFTASCDEAKRDALDMLKSPERKFMFASNPLSRLRKAALTYKNLPTLYSRQTPEKMSPEQREIEHRVPDWNDVHKSSKSWKVNKPNKAKGQASGRTYTSQYRGVHQTFPTKRWEAQFRRNGKPTSLGCFDGEEEAARAYDKMMIWCELNNSTPLKAGITNFDISEYEKDIAYLSVVSQDELTQALRQNGRNQAAKRSLRNKRDSQLSAIVKNST